MVETRMFRFYNSTCAIQDKYQCYEVKSTNPVMKPSNFINFAYSIAPDSSLKAGAACVPVRLSPSLEPRHRHPGLVLSSWAQAVFVARTPPNAANGKKIKTRSPGYTPPVPSDLDRRSASSDNLQHTPCPWSSSMRLCRLRLPTAPRTGPVPASPRREGHQRPSSPRSLTR